MVEFRPSPFSFGYIYDYDDPDPCKEDLKKGKYEKIKSYVSVGTTTDKLNGDDESQIYTKAKKEILDEPLEATTVQIQNHNLKSVESQTNPMGLDFLIEAYKCERKYSPAKDIFYTNVTNVNNVTSKPPRHIPPNTTSLSQSSMPPSLPPTSKVKTKFVLPAIPSFKSLSASKENKNGKDTKMDDKNSKKEFSLNKCNQNKSKESIEKDAAIILKEPFVKLNRAVVSPPPTGLKPSSNTNGLLDQDKSPTEVPQNQVPKVIATVAPTMCSSAKPTSQTVPKLSQASIPCKNSTAEVLKGTKEVKQDDDKNSDLKKDLKTSRVTDTLKQGKNPESIKISDSSKKEESGIRKKVRDLTHLSDSPLFNRSNLSASKTPINGALSDHKIPGKYSTNSALQLFYQTIGSRQPSLYGSSSLKSNLKSPYSSQSKPASEGYKFNAYKYK